MASKNKKFNVKHMGGNVDRKESEQVTKDYEVCVLFWKFLLSLSLDDFWLDILSRARSKETDLSSLFSFLLLLLYLLPHLFNATQQEYFKEQDDSKRTGNYTDVVNKYYDLAT